MPATRSSASLSAGPPSHAAQVIRRWRRRVGLTQEGLAQALSVTFSTVSGWENEKVLPSKLAWRALQQLAAELGSPLEDGAHEDGGPPARAGAPGHPDRQPLQSCGSARGAR